MPTALDQNIGLARGTKLGGGVGGWWGRNPP